MSKYRINPQKQDLTIQDLIRKINLGYEVQKINRDLTEDEILKYNNSIIIAPDYQREYRFTIDDESALIESVLAGIPIPPIFLVTDRHKKSRVINVVDGQHRLRALHRFINNKFALKNLQLLTEFEGLRYKDLDIDVKGDFESSILVATVFNDFPGLKFELEIFNRYNKGTKPLSPQEIRHAVYSSQFNSYVNDFVYQLFEYKSPTPLYIAYNVTKDRLQKKKIQEGIFVILSILENGINEQYDKSLVYAEKYMEEKAHLEKVDVEEAEKNLMEVKECFKRFNDFLALIQSKVEYPFSKEIYGVSSRNYKFQISIAMILAAIFHKITNIDSTMIDAIQQDSDKMNKFLESVKNILTNSYLEDPNYNASSTNSKEMKKLVDAIEFNLDMK